MICIDSFPLATLSDSLSDDDNDPIQYGLDHHLTLRHKLSLEQHLVFLYDALRGTKPPVKDNHGKRARAAAAAVLEERPDVPDVSSVLGRVLATRPDEAFQSLDSDRRTFCERVFTARGLCISEDDLGFSSANRRLEWREVEAEVAGFRDADLGLVWLPVRSEAWCSELELPGESQLRYLTEEALVLEADGFNGDDLIGEFKEHESAVAMQLAPTYKRTVSWLLPCSHGRICADRQRRETCASHQCCCPCRTMMVNAFTTTLGNHPAR